MTTDIPIDVLRLSIKTQGGGGEEEEEEEKVDQTCTVS